MVNQYSKTAQKSFDMPVNIYENKNKVLTINLGLQFLPKILFLKINCNLSEFYFVKITKTNELFRIRYFDSEYTFKIIEITAENLKIQITSVSDTSVKGRIKEFVAIG